jgi:hypothetical protein
MTKDSFGNMVLLVVGNLLNEILQDKRPFLPLYAHPKNV